MEGWSHMVCNKWMQSRGSGDRNAAAQRMRHRCRHELCRAPVGCSAVQLRPLIRYLDCAHGGCQKRTFLRVCFALNLAATPAAPAAPTRCRSSVRAQPFGASPVARCSCCRRHRLPPPLRRDGGVARGGALRDAEPRGAGQLCVGQQAAPFWWPHLQHILHRLLGLRLYSSSHMGAAVGQDARLVCAPQVRCTCCCCWVLLHVAVPVMSRPAAVADGAALAYSQHPSPGSPAAASKVSSPTHAQGCFPHSCPRSAATTPPR